MSREGIAAADIQPCFKALQIAIYCDCEQARNPPFDCWNVSIKLFCVKMSSRESKTIKPLKLFIPEKRSPCHDIIDSDCKSFYRQY